MSAVQVVAAKMFYGTQSCEARLPVRSGSARGRAVVPLVYAVLPYAAQGSAPCSTERASAR
eukprot:1702073-Alexandrium_andersonii.AAC.1